LGRARTYNRSSFPVNQKSVAPKPTESEIETESHDKEASEDLFRNFAKSVLEETLTTESSLELSFDLKPEDIIKEEQDEEEKDADEGGDEEDGEDGKDEEEDEEEDEEAEEGEENDKDKEYKDGEEAEDNETRDGGGEGGAEEKVESEEGELMQ